ncbi:Protein kinase domain-containing protein [Trichoderma simmonsii]|uniref:Protein kinase domain-containing protein n=1 Tax=Trichoderma simmonsii TaxID=1491479 RepID=A0A8G0PK12_9HYPO|nr:Protein kinase domain-containing protein [Trichoderma simmonsii]
MGPELAFAVQGCMTESTTLLIALIKKINEVRGLKKKCEALGHQACILIYLLGKNRDAITSFKTLGQFTACLNRIDAFVSAIKQSRFFERSLKLYWTHEYQSLTSEISSVKSIFIVESVAEILSREDLISKQLGSVLKTQGEQKEILLYLQASAKLIQGGKIGSLSSAPIVELHTDFQEKDFTFSFEAQDGLLKRGTVNGVSQIMCYKIELTRSMPEFLKIYKNVQAGAYVQRLFGTVKLGENYYVVMQDLEDGKTLASACRDNGLPDTPLARVSLAYNIAKTMAWYHNAQLLLKSVSDHTIVLQELSSGRLAPFLTKLQNARHILEQTTGLKYDVRYEAPEYERLREHTKYTDIWSLGVIIWQCLTGSVPYDIPTEVGAEDKDYAKLREALDMANLPGDVNASGLSGLRSARDLIAQCWSRNPLLRPTAASAAEILLDLRVQLVISPPNTLGGAAETEQALKPKCEATGEKEKPLQPNNNGEVEVEKADNDDADNLDPRKIEEAMNAALAAVVHARKLNEKKQAFQQSEAHLSKDQFRLLSDKGGDRSPVENFLIGAVIFWNVCDVVEEEIESARIVGLALSAEGMRAHTSITYLQSAAETGYTEAYLELFKAHATLAREFRSKSF